MALVLADRVRESTLTTGTGTVTLVGPVTGYQTFAAIGDGNTTYYTISNPNGTEWEVGIGTYTAASKTLSRDTVLSSSNGGLLTSFSVGSKDVFVSYPAEKSINQDEMGNTFVPNLGATTPSTGAFTTVNIDAPTTDASITNDTGITSWVYSGKSFAVTTQDSTPQGIFFKADGTEMFVTGSANDRVYRYLLSVAWDVSTAVFNSQSPAITQDSTPIDLYFSPDGLTLMILGNTNDTVYQYALSVAWDVTTSTYASKSFSVTTQEATPAGLWFKNDGLSMYVIGTSADTVFQYTLSSAWDISTASYSGKSFSVAAQEGSGNAVNLSDDGSKMWVFGSAGDDINEYALSTPWDVTTASFVNNVFVGFQEGTGTGLFINTLGSNRVYIVGSGTDTIYQYNTVSDALKVTSNKLYLTGEQYVDGNFYAGNQAAVENNLTVFGSTTLSTTSVSGTLTASSTLTLTGSTTGTAAFATALTTANTTIATAQTTGTLTIGGTTQTGAITLGQSTGAQTLNLGTGATTNGTTKVINLGTAGVSGSTTNINIGSSVSGSLGTTTISAPTVNIGQTATQFAVTNTASAVNYVQVTGGATGATPVISVQGSDATRGLEIRTKGNGTDMAFANGSGQWGFYVTAVNATANQFNVRSAATGFTPTLASQGSDTNIAATFQSKGTGAINLATGSSGVNVSNGNTVTAITRTAAGSGYTSFPTITISAPTTAGGVQATASPTTMIANVATVQAGGTGYTLNDVVTLSGGTPSVAATYTVTGVSGGVVTAVTPLNFGTYTVLPANPVSTTGGTGTGLTLNVTYAVPNSFTITNAGSGYVEQPTVTFSGGGGSGAAAIAVVGSIPVIRSVNSGLFLSAAASSSQPVLRLESVGNPANSLFIYNNATGNDPVLRAIGTDTNVSTIISSQGTGSVRFFTNAVNQEQLRVTHTASAVNYVQVTGAATTATPTISSQGSDTNVSLNFVSKGTGVIRFYTAAGSSEQFRVLHTAGTIVNYAAATGSATGAAPAFSVAGSDTNIDLALTPKGTGRVRFGTHTATADTAISGYIEILDSGGTVRRLAVIT